MEFNIQIDAILIPFLPNFTLNRYNEIAINIPNEMINESYTIISTKEAGWKKNTIIYTTIDPEKPKIPNFIKNTLLNSIINKIYNVKNLKI